MWLVSSTSSICGTDNCMPLFPSCDTSDNSYNTMTVAAKPPECGSQVKVGYLGYSQDTLPSWIVYSRNYFLIVYPPYFHYSYQVPTEIET